MEERNYSLISELNAYDPPSNIKLIKKYCIHGNKPKPARTIPTYCSVCNSSNNLVLGLLYC